MRNIDCKASGCNQTVNPTVVSVILLIYRDHHSWRWIDQSHTPRLLTELQKINERPVEHQMARHVGVALAHCSESLCSDLQIIPVFLLASVLSLRSPEHWLQLLDFTASCAGFSHDFYQRFLSNVLRWLVGPPWTSSTDQHRSDFFFRLFMQANTSELITWKYNNWAH